jgi:hypothetical protein
MDQRRENGLPIHQDKPDIAAAAAVVEVLAAVAEDVIVSLAKSSNYWNGAKEGHQAAAWQGINILLTYISTSLRTSASRRTARVAGGWRSSIHASRVGSRHLSVSDL